MKRKPISDNLTGAQFEALQPVLEIVDDLGYLLEHIPSRDDNKRIGPGLTVKEWRALRDAFTEPVT